METYKKSFDKGDKRTRNKEYRAISYKLSKERKRIENIWTNLSNDEKLDEKRKVKSLEQELMSTLPTLSQDENYKRLVYVRYADDFLIGVIGSKEDAKRIKSDLTKFLKEHLRLNLSQEKTLITHSEKKTKFLGYEIRVKRDKSFNKNKGVPSRVHNLIPELYMPKSAWQNKLFDENIAFIDRKTGIWKPKARPELAHNDDLEILMTYNARIKGLYEYYKLAVNVCNLNKYKYFAEYSMYQTFGRKYKLSTPQIISKFSVNGVFTIKYNTKRGICSATLYNGGFKRNLTISSNNVDFVAKVEKYSGRNSLIKRLQACKCEWCEAENIAIHMHHVRKLKDLKGKKQWEKQMISRKRKTMALCENCHNLLHSGKLD